MYDFSEKLEKLTDDVAVSDSDVDSSDDKMIQRVLMMMMMMLMITGQHDDARMCLALAVTAAKLGAAVANYTEVTELIKTSDSIVAGAKVKDRITGRLRPIIIIIIIINEKISVAFSPKTARTRNTQKRRHVR